MPPLFCRGGILSICFFLVLANPALAGKCADARATLRGYIANMPVQAYLCDKTDDCKPFFIYAEPCDAPVILGFLGTEYVGNMTPALIQLQRKVRAVCPEPEQACTPVIPAFACVKNICRVQKPAQ